MNTFTICIHGGAGVINRDTDPARIALYREGLREALEAGRRVLADGGTALDAVEAAVISMEENALFNAGKGAVYNSAGGHELDAAIMDGESLECGALAGVRRIRNPVRAARHLMKTSPHVLLAGDAADAWAAEEGIETVENSFFDDEYRYVQWQKAREAGRIQMDHADSEKHAAQKQDESIKGTVGAVALDRAGNLAAATSTGGMTNKRYGRVGDTPIIGAGTYANNSSCAVSCTGTGEEFIRHVAAHSVHARMSLAGEALAAAADHIVHKTLKPGDGGLIAVARDGSWAMPYNSQGMFRGMANSQGQFLISIWDEE